MTKQAGEPADSLLQADVFQLFMGGAESAAAIAAAATIIEDIFETVNGRLYAEMILGAATRAAYATHCVSALPTSKAQRTDGRIGL